MAYSTSLPQSDKNLLTVIRTDLTEPEGFMLHMAEKSREKHPQRFTGRTPCVFYRLRYVPPCENFRELKNLILRIENAKGLRANFRGIVALEASEWIGHEQEEYFSIVLKYMYDHREYFHCAMILKDCPQQRLQRFLDAVDVFITPRVLDGNVFSEPARLTGYITEIFGARGCPIRRNAAEALAEILGRPNRSKARSLSMIERTADEVIGLSGSPREITERHVERYLAIRSPETAAPVPVSAREERRNAFEQLLL